MQLEPWTAKHGVATFFTMFFTGFTGLLIFVSFFTPELAVGTFYWTLFAISMSYFMMFLDQTYMTEPIVDVPTTPAPQNPQQ
jgi:hypothetical protein